MLSAIGKLVWVPYRLKFSKIKYFAVWLNSAQKQIFTDKIFVVERARELCKATPTQLLARTTITLESGPVGHESLPSARLTYCNRDIRARNDVKVRTKT